MREISLIKDLEYKREYDKLTTVNGETYIDGNHYTSWVSSLNKNVYKADEIVTLNSKYNNIVDNVVNRYIKLFTERGLKATTQQIDFARETSKILLGKLKDNKIIPVVPAPCGFGKSTITQVFLEEICVNIKNGIINDGIIVVTDKIDQLNELHNNLKKTMGSYKTKIGESYKELKTEYSYVLEGWREDSYERGVCLNKDIKNYEYGMCSNSKCPFYGQCKIMKQKIRQRYSPILLITNARLETFGENLSMYNTYIDKDDKVQKRTLKINDEKPAMRDIFTINIKVLNDIENELYSVNNIEDRRVLIDKFENVMNIIKGKFKDYENYDRMIISNINNTPILLNDIDFVKLWNRYMGTKFQSELIHIQRVLTKGGLYVNTTDKKGIFINTLGMKNIVDEEIKTVIFDATALIDQDYSNENIIKFLDVKNPRTYENVTFEFYMNNKLTKTEFNNKKYLIDACVKFLEHINPEKTYVVTYCERAKTILNKLKNNMKVSINSKESFGRMSNPEHFTPPVRILETVVPEVKEPEFW